MPSRPRCPDFGYREEHERHRPSAPPQRSRGHSAAPAGGAWAGGLARARGVGGRADGAGLKERRADGGEEAAGPAGRGRHPGGIREQSREQSRKESPKASRRQPVPRCGTCPGTRPGSFRPVGKWTLRDAGLTRDVETGFCTDLALRVPERLCRERSESHVPDCKGRVFLLAAALLRGYISSKCLG